MKNGQISTVPALKDEFQESFSIGAAVNIKTIQTQKQLLIHHFNSITAENDMKFESLQPKEGEFTFEKADNLMAFAMNNGMKMRGHTLVWHNQTPDWVFSHANGELVDKQTLLQRMQEHISTVVKRYKGKIYAWDVVNEAVAD